ncbi:MAG: acetyltransferase [Gelidibacter sp.]
MKKIVIIGASGHGGMILDCIEKEGKYSFLGFMDSYKKKGTTYSGYSILGNEHDIPQLIAEHDLYGAIIAIGNNWTRKKMMDKLIKITPKLNFVTIIHPNTVISNNVQIGKGTIIMPGAIVNSNSKIGNFCILNTNSSLGHDGVMEDYSSISSGVCIGGNLRLGEFSAVSLGANIIENITIGKHCVIGAGSLVVKNVVDNSLVYGSPARFVRNRSMEDPYLKGDSCLPKHSGSLSKE